MLDVLQGAKRGFGGRGVVRDIGITAEQTANGICGAIQVHTTVDVHAGAGNRPTLPAQALDGGQRHNNLVIAKGVSGVKNTGYGEAGAAVSGKGGTYREI